MPPPIGPGVLFDSVLLLRQDTTGQINDFVNAANNEVLPAGIVQFSGSEQIATLPLSLFPTTGFDAEDYTFNFWPRVGLGNNSQVSDFAPDQSNSRVTAVPLPGSGTSIPEPGSLDLFMAAVGMLWFIRRKVCGRVLNTATKKGDKATRGGVVSLVNVT